MAQNVILGTVTIGNSTMTNSGVTAQELDIGVDSATLNGQLPPDLTNIGFEAGQLYYDLFFIDGMNLYYGDIGTGDTRSPANRTTDIDFNIVYRKQ